MSNVSENYPSSIMSFAAYPSFFLQKFLGGFYKISHGITNTLVLPPVMKFNLSANVEKFAKTTEFMGANVKGLDVKEASKKSVSAVKELSRDIGLPQTLREVGVKREDIPALVEMIFKWANESGNPREVSKKQLRELYEKAY